MDTVWFVAGRDLRRRWRRIVALALLVGVAAAFTFALAAGARRTGSALARFTRSSRAADIELDAAVTPEQIDGLRTLPGVANLSGLRALGVVIPAAPDFFNIGAPIDDTFGTTVDRNRIVAGRAANPDAADEVTLGEGIAARLGVRAGGTIAAASFTPAQIADTLAGKPVGAPAGPRPTLRVVGIARGPLDLGDRGAANGLLVLSPAFARAHAHDIGVFGTRIFIRTTRGEADVPRVLASARSALGSAIFSSQDLTIGAQGARHAIDVFALALWIGAAVAVVAGAFVVGIVVSREVALFNRDQRTLRDLGCTRRDLALCSAPMTALVIAGGALLAVGLAIAASYFFPIGIARRAEPDIGVHADWTTMLIGTLSLAAIVGSVAIVTAYRATAYRPERASAANARTAIFLDRIAATRATPTFANGARMAVEPGEGTTAIPVRSAILGAVIGVLGVSAALVFAANVDHLVATPRRYGVDWTFAVRDITTNTPCGGTTYGVERAPAVASLAEMCLETVEINHRVVPGAAFTPLRGTPIWPPILEGRRPSAPNEVALGSKTLRQIGKHIGDTITIAGRAKQLDYVIVGRTVLPTLGDGALFTGAGYAPLFDPNLFERDFVGTLAPGADLAALAAQTHREQLAAPVTPVAAVEVDRLRQVNWLPVALAAFLAGLASLAIAHALVTTTRRRRRDLAVLKTLGFDDRQVRATVAWQATTLGTIGIVFGVPLGIVAGTFAWRLLARGLGVSNTASIPLLALLATIAGALVLVNVIAYFPARAAAHQRVADALRSE